MGDTVGVYNWHNKTFDVKNVKEKDRNIHFCIKLIFIVYKKKTQLNIYLYPKNTTLR